MKKIIFLLLVLFTAANNYSQSITNTLGTSGQFSVKDGSTTFMSLNQSNGNISFFRNLELGEITNSTSAIGVISKNGERFIHNYKSPTNDGFNTFIGINSGNFTMSSSFPFRASYNTAMGYLSLNSLTSGSNNSAFGSSSLSFNTSGEFNSAFGAYSLLSNTTGLSNSAFGHQSLHTNTTGSSNSAFGNNSLYSNTTGSSNSAFGNISLYSNTTGNENSAYGYQSLLSNTTGSYNSAFGGNSLFANTSGSGNSTFGYQSLINNSTGNLNSAFGHSAITSNTTGSNNSAFGSGSLYTNTSGFFNAAVGSFALYSNDTGTQNTALGHKSLYSNVSGFQNTAVGDSALYKNTGNFNTAIGYNAGSNVTSGANLTLIGIDANPSSPTAIDQITLGNIYVSSLRCNVQTITSLSDKRDKKNITNLTLGLDFITKLKPRQFNWDKRDWYEDGNSDGTKMQETPTAGFIAQEFDELQNAEHAEWLNLVLKDNPDKWEATYGNLLPVMVKAIQELNEENQNLKIKNQNLENRLAKFEEIQSDLVKKLEQIESNEESLKVQMVNSEINNQ